MDIKILAQNIVNNPGDFTAEQIEQWFEEYASYTKELVWKAWISHTTEEEYALIMRKNPREQFEKWYKETILKSK